MKRIIAIALLAAGIASILLFPSIWFFIGMTISILGFILLIRKPENKISKNVQSEIDR